MKIVGGAGLGLVALLSWFGQVHAQAHARAAAPAVPLAELVGSWLGYPVMANGAADTSASWHLAVRADSAYLWHAAPNYTELFGVVPQRLQALRGDTLALDSAHVYTVQRTGTPDQPELWLRELPGTGTGRVFRLQREWTAMAHTGRAIKCTNGRIGSFACKNVELLSYLPKEAIGNSAGYDMWGWHDSATGREFLISTGDAVAFIEVTDPVHPRYLGLLVPHDSVTTYQNLGSQRNVRVYQHYAFVAYDVGQSKNGLQIFDLTQLRDVKEPQAFHETAHFDGFDFAHTLTLNPETGLLTANTSRPCGEGLSMVDVRTPLKPVFAGCYAEPPIAGHVSGGIHDAQCVIYRGPDRRYQGREICVNYAYVGVSIADVTDRQHPKTISTVTYPDVAATHQGWFTADQRYVFLDDELDEYGMWGRLGSLDSVRARTIGLDLTKLDEPVVLVQYYNPNDRTGDHNLFINGRYMYQGNGGGGLQIIDVANPKAPKAVGYLAPKHNDASDKAFSDENGIWHGARAFGTYPYFKQGVVALSLTTGVALARLLTPGTR